MAIRVDGVFYPRAGTLGGCTAHNAMILVYPHNQDWQEIADATCDPSWAPDRMRKYFEKLENCHHRPLERFFKELTGLESVPARLWRMARTPNKALPLQDALDDKDLFKRFASHQGRARGVWESGRADWFRESKV